MNRAGRVEARIDPKLKASVEAILAKIGLSPAEAVRLFYKQVELHKGLPFEVRIPNKKTLKAIRDLDEGRNLTTYESLEQFKKSLEL